MSTRLSVWAPAVGVALADDVVEERVDVVLTAATCVVVGVACRGGRRALGRGVGGVQHRRGRREREYERDDVWGARVDHIGGGGAHPGDRDAGAERGVERAVCGRGCGVGRWRGERGGV